MAIETAELPKATSANWTQTSGGKPRAPYLVAGGLIIFAAALFIFRELAPLFQQLLMAVFVVYLIVPVHNWLLRHHVPSWTSYTLIALAVSLFVTVVGWLVYDNLASLSNNIPAYRKQMDSFIDQAAAQLPGISGTDIKSSLEQSKLFERGIQLTTATLGTFFSVFGHLSIVLVFVIFLLIDQQSLRQRVQKSFDHNAQRILEGAAEVNKAVGKYIQVTTICNLAIGIFTALVLLAFGVDAPFAWGVVAFLLPYIPYVGPFIAATAPGLFAIIVLQNPWYGVLVLVLLHISHFVVGNLLEPLLLGQGLHISPLMVIISLVFWGLLWGITGMVLSVPLLVVTKVILENIPETKSLAMLMSARGSRMQE